MIYCSSFFWFPAATSWLVNLYPNSWISYFSILSFSFFSNVLLGVISYDCLCNPLICSCLSSSSLRNSKENKKHNKIFSSSEFPNPFSLTIFSELKLMRVPLQIEVQVLIFCLLFLKFFGFLSRCSFSVFFEFFIFLHITFHLVDVVWRLFVILLLLLGKIC